MQEIKKDNKILAIYFDGNFNNGTEPLTNENLALQVIALNHPSGKILASHSHKPKKRETDRLVEFLLVLYGKVKITIYDGDQKYKEIILTAHQGIMLIEGGVGIEILENAKMLEFKNGPFLEDKVVIE